MWISKIAISNFIKVVSALLQETIAKEFNWQDLNQTWHI